MCISSKVSTCVISSDASEEPKENVVRRKTKNIKKKEKKTRTNFVSLASYLDWIFCFSHMAETHQAAVSNADK